MTGVVAGSQGTGVLEGHRPGTGVAAPGGGFEIVDAGAWDATATNTVILEYPSLAKQGNRLWSVVHGLPNGGLVENMPDLPGWALEQSWDLGNQKHQLWSKTATGSEPTSDEFIGASGGLFGGGMFATTDGSNAIQAVPKVTANQDVVTSTPADVAAGALVVTLATTAGPATFGAPSRGKVAAQASTADISAQLSWLTYQDGGTTDVITTSFGNTSDANRGVTTLEFWYTPTTATFEFEQAAPSASSWTVGFETVLNPMPGTPLDLFFRGASGRGGVNLRGGEVTAKRTFKTGERLWWYVGASTQSISAGGGYPGGGGGKSGQAFTQAGGGAGYSGLLKSSPHPNGTPIIVAGGSGGDPNGTQDGSNGAAGGFAGTADAALPNVTGTSGRGGSTIGGFGGVNGTGQPGSLLQGGNGDQTNDRSGGGGGYYGGAGGGDIGLEGGGGSSYADPDCTDVVFANAASTFDYGRLQVSGTFALPPAAARMLAQSPTSLFPCWDALGQQFVDVTGRQNAVRVGNNVYSEAVSSSVLAPDGFYYFSPPVNPDDPTQTSTTKVASSGLQYPTFDSGHTGFTQQMFVSRQGPRFGVSIRFCGNAIDLGSDVTQDGGVSISSSDGGDFLLFCGAAVGALDIFDVEDEWHHVFFRLRADNVSEIYLDGVLVATGNWTGTATGTFYPAAGRRAAFNDSIDAPRNIGLANVGVWLTDIGFDQAEVDATMLDFGIPRIGP